MAVRLIYFLLALLLVLLGLLFWLMAVPEPAAATGSSHSIFSAMNAGGDGLARLGEGVHIIGWLGSVSFLIMVLLTILGVQAKRRDRLFWVLMGLVVALSQTVWWSMYSTYLEVWRSGLIDYAFGFPVPTSWMLFGVWLSGGVLCLVYVIGFRRFIFTEADEVAYEQLRAEAEVPRVVSSEIGSG